MPRCKICNKKFEARYFNQRACSKECNSEYLEQNTPKRINYQSENRAEQEKIYQRKKKIYMDNHKVCECGCGRPSEDLHHRAGRIGSLLTDERYFMAVSRICHGKIHTNPKESREKGWLITINK